MNCDVSVVIPTYNSSSTLKRALDSVYGQSLLPREIIVVDDGSEDWEQSRLILASCPASIANRFLRLGDNRGVSTARNVAISAAQSRYLALLDSDDVWFQNKLAIQYDLLTRHSLDFSMHRYRDDLQPGRRENQDSPRPEQLSWSRFSTWTPLLRNDSTSTVMVLRQKMVRYDPSLRRGEDFKCYMELLSNGCRGAYIPHVLGGSFKSTIGVSGLSKDVQGMHAGRILGLQKLIAEARISTLQYLVGMGMETVKYPIRVGRVWMRPRAAKHHGKPQTASL